MGLQSVTRGSISTSTTTLLIKQRREAGECTCTEVHTQMVLGEVVGRTGFLNYWILHKEERASVEALVTEHEAEARS